MKLLEVKVFRIYLQSLNFLAVLADIFYPFNRGGMVLRFEHEDEQHSTVQNCKPYYEPIEQKLAYFLLLNLTQETADLIIEQVAEGVVGDEAPYPTCKNLVVSVHSIVDSAEAN